MTQTTMATAAAVLDDAVETPQALAWLFEPGESRGNGGGHIAATLIGEVDRDGVGNEAAPGYCFIWMNLFYRCAKALDRCKVHHSYDLHRDFPRLKRMYSVPYRLTLLDQYTPNIGDTGFTGNASMASVDKDRAVDLFAQFGDVYDAQLAYKLNGNKADGLHTSVFDADPEGVQQAVLDVIEQHGELHLGSANLNGYGFAAFRHGEEKNRRAAWLYYGRNGGHGHRDRLNYGLFYRGMDVLPELGYPEYADLKWPKRAGWTINTLSHNTVMVNKQHQKMNWIGHCQMFAALQGIDVIEVASPEVYAETEDYRRTFVMVDIDETESYLVDFFRVTGGDDHVLSFHAGEGDVKTDGLSLTVQEKGTYAGEDIPFGEHYDGPPDGRYTGSGFSYIYDVARAQKPKAGWWADWALVDTWGTKIGDGDVNVRFHGLSDVDDVTLGWGDPPQNKPGNPRRLRYALLHNARYQSAFVSVVEPYSHGTPNLRSVSRLDLPDAACGVRVETVDGRVDWVVSNDVPEQVLDLGEGITFTGRFFQVSLRDAQPESILLMGGSCVTTSVGTLRVDCPAFTGVVKDFHREETGVAWLDVTGDVLSERVVGAQLRVLNDGVRDACYVVQGVTKTSDGLRFNLGDTSFIRGLQSLEDYSAGYVYDIAIGNAVEILHTVRVRFASGQVIEEKASVDWHWSAK
jgi:oligo-alginate lyase